MERIHYKMIAILGALILLLTACAQSAEAQWQEQYDLGVRYLSDGNYEEAIIAFTAAIEIDPNRAEAYVGRGDAYIGSGETEDNLAAAEADYEEAIALDETDTDAYLGLADVYIRRGEYDRALEILNRALEVADDTQRISDKIAEFEMQQIALELEPRISELSVPFTVDEIVLGISGIEIAKNAYGNRPYALNNLMNDDTEDTVYVCFGDGTPIPEGYERDEFGFLFAGAQNNGLIHHIVIQDSSFTCLGSLQIGDSSNAVFILFDLVDVSDRLYGTMTCSTGNGRMLQYSGDPENFDLIYQEDNQKVQINVTDGKIHSIIMALIEN